MRTVTVTGHGSATAVPDTAALRLSVVHQAATLTDALAGAESAREAVVTALVGSPAGAAAVIGSSGLSVWPATDNEGRPVGFSAEHTLTVRCTGLDDAGALVNVAAAAVGARLRVQGVSLVVADASDSLVAARHAAWNDAEARASHLALLAGAALGPVEQVEEGGGGGLGGRMMAQSAKVAFAPGETGIEASLTVTWQLA